MNTQENPLIHESKGLVEEISLIQQAASKNRKILDKDIKDRELLRRELAIFKERMMNLDSKLEYINGLGLYPY